MSTTSTTANNRDLNTIINEENVQSFINKNKTAVVAIVALIVGLIIGVGFYKTVSDKSKTEYNSKIHAFETTTLKDFSTKATDQTLAKKVETDLKALSSSLGNYIGLFPVVIKASDLLMANGFNQEAKETLIIGEKIASDDYAKYFVFSRKVALLEDLKDEKEAIATLEKMTSLKTKIFLGKTYLDLGRLYLKSNDKEKAKKNLTYVIEQAKDDAEFVKMAQLYLSKI